MTDGTHTDDERLNRPDAAEHKAEPMSGVERFGR
jgi:hypothetical protein